MVFTANLKPSGEGGEVDMLSEANDAWMYLTKLILIRFKSIACMS